MRMVKRLVGLLTHNFGWKLLSLAIAVVVWGMVANEPELSTFTTVGVEYKNLPENLEIASDPVTSVKLELSGPSGELRGTGTGGGQPEVILDMSKVQPGERTFPIGDGNIKLVRGVHFVRSMPAEVHFRFERHAERVAKVAPRFTERSGYEVTDFSVSPEALIIAGPASHVQHIDTVVTDPIDIPGRAGAYTFSVNGFIGDPFVRFPDPQTITVHATVVRR